MKTATLLPAELYEEDFYAWTQDQARELRRLKGVRPNVPLDLEHLAEEVADLGKDQRHALRSWTRPLDQILGDWWPDAADDGDLR